MMCAEFACLCGTCGACDACASCATKDSCSQWSRVPMLFRVPSVSDDGNPVTAKGQHPGSIQAFRAFSAQALAVFQHQFARTCWWHASPWPTL
eukprot:9757581-Alexandrium_andersonii.AAC.1